MSDELYHYKASGLDIYLVNGFTVEETPYGPGVTIQNADGLHEAIALGLIDKKGLLEPNEFRYLRNFIEMSQGAFGDYIGRGAQTVARWEKGEVPLPEYANREMRILVDAHIHDGTAQIKKLIDQINKIEAECYKVTASLDDTGWHVECEREAA